MAFDAPAITADERQAIAGARRAALMELCVTTAMRALQGMPLAAGANEA